MLEQRVSMNEESVDGVFAYFKEARESSARRKNQVMYFNPEAMIETITREKEERLIN